MRRGAVVRLVALGLVLGAAASAVAVLVDWLPESASKERGGIDFVFWFTTWICVGIFALVAAVIVYSVLRFRAAPDDDSDGAPIHGNTKLEIVWTAVPAILVTAISIVSGVVLARNDRIPSDALRVEVTGEQFAWSFKYPDADNLASGGVLRLPRGRPVRLLITAKDVIHSFWVPEFGQKLDALPGSVNHLKVTPTKVGTYDIICTELCGVGHALMRSEAMVMPPEEFDAWVRDQGRTIDDGGEAAGKAVYVNNGCGACHTFTPAGTKAAVGPDLDKLPAQAQGAGKPLEEFVRESIVEPKAYVEPGFPGDLMPGIYGDQLEGEQLDALVDFLVKGAR
ncbi:MAG: cytochrome c oxidase subunit II [Gaiellaceae bacterium]